MSPFTFGDVQIMEFGNYLGAMKQNARRNTHYYAKYVSGELHITDSKNVRISPRGKAWKAVRAAVEAYEASKSRVAAAIANKILEAGILPHQGGSTVQEISYRESAPGIWRVTFDGRVLGDSRGHDKEGARAEALKIVNEEHARATREGRHATRVFKPWF